MFYVSSVTIYMLFICLIYLLIGLIKELSV